MTQVQATSNRLVRLVDWVLFPHSSGTMRLRLSCLIVSMFLAAASGRADSTVLERAQTGDAAAQFELGAMCEKGTGGVTQNLTRAVKWYRMAAEKGSVKAQASLGTIYYSTKNLDIPRDTVEAIKWWRKAAASGDAQSQYNLGLAYFTGDGVDRNDQQALAWWTKSAEQDNVDAMYSLATMRVQGDRVPKDGNEALKWFLKAALKGHAGSQFNLATMYWNGDGIPRNQVEAFAWVAVSAASGDGESLKYARMIRARLTTEEVMAAKKRNQEIRTQIELAAH
jgi:TPR repeat protein